MKTKYILNIFLFLLFIVINISDTYSQYLNSGIFEYHFQKGNNLDQTMTFGASLECHINAADSYFDLWRPQIKGIFKFNECTAYMINNTNHDGRLLFLTKNNVFPAVVNVGDTVDFSLIFQYESNTWENPVSEPAFITVNATVVLLERSGWNYADRVLVEIVNNGNLPDIDVEFLGWDKRDLTISPITQAAVFGHPQGDIKKGTLATITGEDGLYIYTKIFSVDGAIESGSSGSPLIDQNGRVRGDVRSGSVYDCYKSIQSYITFSKIGSDWEKWKPYLDPGNTGVEYCEGTTAPLPVELISFTADIDEDNVVLRWITATEVNNYGFEVERSTSSVDWEMIGFVEGHGNSNSPKYYQFVDNNPLADMLTYRLKQVDTDGNFEYFSEIAETDLTVTNINNETLPTEYELSQNYPNPFNPSTVINYSIPESGLVILKVFNILGQEVAELVNDVKSAGTYEVSFDASSLTTGMYIYKIQSGNYTATKKMLLAK